MRQIKEIPEEDKARIVGYWVATDKCMSGWGLAPGRSLVAVPVTDFRGEDYERVYSRLAARPEMKRLRFRWANDLNGIRLYKGDHLHAYDLKSFRYSM